MSKIDRNYAAILGGIIVFFVIPIFLNLGFFGIFKNPITIAFATSGFFVVFVVGAPVGLWVFNWAARRWSTSIFEVGKYGLVGLANTAINAGIINTFMMLTGIVSGLWLDGFFIFAFFVSITNGFFWNKLWTFGVAGSRSSSEYLRYFGVTCVTVGASSFLFHVLVNVIGAPASISPNVWANIALGILIPVAFLGNFLGTKFFVFQPRRDVIPTIK